ncbi:putative plant self-incompatibility S1 [Helianthus anomalus]
MNLMFHGVLILTMLSFCIASNPNTIYAMRMYVTNAIEDNIVVHVVGQGGDQGNRTLAFNSEFDWKFGVKIGTYYKGEFWWGSKFQSISLFNGQIYCFDGDIFRVQRCYWLIRPDGFWYHFRNDTFPGNWNKFATW